MMFMSKRQIVRYLRQSLNGDFQHPRAPKKKPRKTRSARNWKYRAWIRTLPSAVSGLRPCEAAHTGSDGGMRMKSSDYSCIPLRAEEHLEFHRIGKKAFAERYGIDCAEIAQRLNAVWFKFSREVK